MPAAIIELLAENSPDRATTRRVRRFFRSVRPTRALRKRIAKDTKSRGFALSSSDVAAAATVEAIAEAAALNTWVRIGGLPVPKKKEVLHNLICGSTGTGKSVTLKELLGDLRRRGDRVIVVDAGYDLSRSFKKEGDIVLSIDQNSTGWDLRNEVLQSSEWRTFAKAFLPASGGGESAQWMQKAQAFFADIGLRSEGKLTNAQLIEAATVWPKEVLKELLAGTGSAPAIETDGYLTSIRSIIGSTIDSLNYTKSGEFSLRKYMAGTKDSRWLWLPYDDAQKTIAARSICGWLDILAIAALGRAADTEKQRTWIIIDELDSIGEIPSLAALLTRGRKSDVCVVAAIQDVSQLDATYGKENAETLFSSFGNKLFLRCGSASLAEKVSQEIGETDFEDEQRNTSESRTGKTSKNVSTSVKLSRARLIVPEQIQTLPDRTGFLSFAGDRRVYRVNLTI